jgi:hypothetical protein
MRKRRASWWKVLGLAGVVGVVATGAVIARAERQRRAYTPEQIQMRLRARYAEADQSHGHLDRPSSA